MSPSTYIKRVTGGELWCHLGQLAVIRQTRAVWSSAGTDCRCQWVRARVSNASFSGHVITASDATGSAGAMTGVGNTVSPRTRGVENDARPGDVTAERCSKRFRHLHELVDERIDTIISCWDWERPTDWQTGSSPLLHNITSGYSTRLDYESLGGIFAARRYAGAVYTASRKNATIFLPSTLPVANRFSKLFHRQTSQSIYSKVVIKYPTTPQTRRYTTLWNINVRKKQKQPETCILIIDTSQRSVATWFRCCGTFDRYFTTYLLLSLFWEKINCSKFGKLRGKVYCLKRPVLRGTVLLKKMNKSSAVAEMGDRLVTVDMGRKWGLLCLFPLVS